MVPPGAQNVTSMKVRTIASRYRVLRELGRGGMGVVYVVEHLHTGERLALKLLHGTAAANPEVIARFKREARAAAQIKSEHVVRVTDADVAPELGGAPFFVMELLEGCDLEKALEKRDRLHPDAVIAILSQVARALDRAHAIGIVHRDLKPENIFLHRREGGAPIAKVLDFGISKFGSREAGNGNGVGTTADGTLMGTPAYMAPEQARGAVEAMGPATDIWAIGLIALRLLTAETYWTADSHGELMVQILVTPMPAPTERWPWLGRAFDVWFARSCNRDPAARWSSVSEQVEALTAALTDVTSADGATMDVLADALRDSPTVGTVPSIEAALPDVPNQIAEPSARARLTPRDNGRRGKRNPQTVRSQPSLRGLDFPRRHCRSHSRGRGVRSALSASAA